MNEPEPDPPSEEKPEPEKGVKVVPGEHGIRLRKGLQSQRPRAYGPPPTDESDEE
jgi:hypothetical protein